MDKIIYQNQYVEIAVSTMLTLGVAYDKGYKKHQVYLVLGIFVIQITIPNEE